MMLATLKLITVAKFTVSSGRIKKRVLTHWLARVFKTKARYNVRRQGHSSRVMYASQPTARPTLLLVPIHLPLYLHIHLHFHRSCTYAYLSGRAHPLPLHCKPCSLPASSPPPPPPPHPLTPNAFNLKVLFSPLRRLHLLYLYNHLMPASHSLLLPLELLRLPPPPFPLPLCRHAPQTTIG